MSAGDASASAASKSKKKPAEHPKYSEMIISAIGALKERKGSSRQKIIKYMKEKYSSLDDHSCDTHVKLALVRMTKNGQLLQQTGKGASGSFKVAPQKEKKPAAKKPKTKKPAAAKPKKKKEATPKKQKTVVKKKKTVKSKKPAEKKKAQKKPTKKPASKTKSAKKSPAKKTPAKKAKKTATKSKSAGSKKRK